MNRPSPSLYLALSSVALIGMMATKILLRQRDILCVIFVLSLVLSTFNFKLMITFDFKSDVAVEAKNVGGAKHSPIFRWDDLDLDREVYCGSMKCLFQTKNKVRISGSGSGSETLNQRAKPNCAAGRTIEYQTGYLIGWTNKMDEAIFDGWKLAQYLEAKFGIKHFFLEPPIQVQIENSRLVPQFLPRLNGNQKDRFMQDLPPMDAMVTTVVQKVAVAPSTFQTIKLVVDDLGDEYVYATEDTILASLEALLDAFRVERGTPDALEDALECGFFLQLDMEISRLIELLHHEPLMALDFQFILDTSGNLYHLDFDRVDNFPKYTLNPFNQTKFDATLRSMFNESLKITTIIRQWIHTKQQQNWEKEENTILAATNLPCLATERVAISKQQTTSTMTGRGAGKKTLRYPLRIAQLQRMIMDGAYGGANVTSWDCNAFGDRVG